MQSRRLFAMNGTTFKFIAELNDQGAGRQRVTHYVVRVNNKGRSFWKPASHVGKKHSGLQNGSTSSTRHNLVYFAFVTNLALSTAHYGGFNTIHGTKSSECEMFSLGSRLLKLLRATDSSS